MFYFIVNNASKGKPTLFSLFEKIYFNIKFIQPKLSGINLSYLKIFVKLFWLFWGFVPRKGSVLDSWSLSI